MGNFLLNAGDLNLWKKIFNKSFLIFILITLYVPLICFILLSFNGASSKNTVSNSIGGWNGIKNYLDFFSGSGDNASGLEDALINSLIIAFISIPISLFIGLMTTISIWKNYGKGKQLTFLFCNVTISCPDIIQAISFSMLFAIFAIPLGLFSVILTHIAIQIPYVVIFLYPKLSKLKINLLLASFDLNFKFFESVVNVIVPSLLPNIFGAALTVFAISFDDYIITNLVRGSINTVSTELYNMKTGIKIWASVFGSLVIVGVLFISLSINTYRFLKDKSKSYV